MSAIKIERGQGENPWLLHASTIQEIDEHLASVQVRRDRDLTDRLLDLRNRLRDLEAPA